VSGLGGAAGGRRRALSSAFVTLVALFLSAEASAQIPGFGGPGGGAPPPSQPPPGTPETHAASGADSALPKSQATLPEDPLAVPDRVAGQIGTDAKSDDAPKGAEGETDIDFYGLYYGETTGQYRFQTVFPFWAERTQPGDRASLFGFYYQRRSVDADADVLFPFFWRLREQTTTTTVAGPFVHQEREASPGKPATHLNWLPPFFFEAKTDDGGGYLHIPALLTFTEHSDHDGFNLVGPLFCKWKGGPACDARTADELSFGVAPLYFYGKDRRSEFELIPPLLHYYSYDESTDRETNLWGPLLWQRHPEGEVFDILPLFYRSWGKNRESTTLLPLFHYGWEDRSHRLVTPLFVHAEGNDGEETFATWGYARYRGRTELDMVTPFFWWFRDPDVGLDTKVLAPFYYESHSPKHDDLAVFPFYARFARPGLEETTWVTPLFRHSHGVTGWSTHLYPFLFTGRTHESTHLVVPPVLWDFATPKSRSTVVLPVFFRFADRESTQQLALNTYYAERNVRGGTEWEFHFFPALSFGNSPQGHWWNVLYGLAGYTREGTMSKMRALWIPFKLSE